MATSMTLKLFVMAAALVGATVFAPAARAQISQESEVGLTTPLEPLRPGVTEDQLFAALLSHNLARNAALLDYTALRTYQVVDLRGKVHAEEIGRMEYRAPDQKKFVVTSEGGSGLIRRMALNPLIASEIEAAAGKEHRDSTLAPANYTLQPIGEQQVGPYHCFVAKAIAKRRDKYLFEGKVWIDVDDYAVVRIEGHPAKKLSFWIEQADFVRQYQKIGNFWLPQEDKTLVQVRLYGKKVLKIDHEDYAVNGAINKYASAQSVPSL
jgi:hypothetical protein